MGSPASRGGRAPAFTIIHSGGSGLGSRVSGLGFRVLNIIHSSGFGLNAKGSESGIRVSEFPA